ncbi:hypothetical protein ECC02_010406 [Trypanosoma cruzi]|uniref:Uncharacterized protein n=1 Tax=Trypanosoma cruzi TaxID=5693 RepID=A0A7J6XQK3_TRYCR|nr:hypothetical protein ECC02_010406 [Trypanosoma cruzi]
MFTMFASRQRRWRKSRHRTTFRTWLWRGRLVSHLLHCRLTLHGKCNVRGKNQQNKSQTHFLSLLFLFQNVTGICSRRRRGLLIDQCVFPHHDYTLRLLLKKPINVHPLRCVVSFPWDPMQRIEMVPSYVPQLNVDKIFQRRRIKKRNHGVLNRCSPLWVLLQFLHEYLAVFRGLRQNNGNTNRQLQTLYLKGGKFFPRSGAATPRVHNSFQQHGKHFRVVKDLPRKLIGSRCVLNQQTQASCACSTGFAPVAYSKQQDLHKTHGHDKLKKSVKMHHVRHLTTRLQ